MTDKQLAEIKRVDGQYRAGLLSEEEAERIVEEILDTKF